MGKVTVAKRNTREEWRDIPSWPNHQASNAGRIRSVNHTAVRTVRGQRVEQRRNGKVLRTFEHTKGRGYLSVGPGYKVHNLVLEAWAGPRPAGMECRHINDVKTDNRVENLAWGNRSENVRDRYTNGPGLSALATSEASKIRAWARQSGLKIGNTGIIPRRIQRSYAERGMR